MNLLFVGNRFLPRRHEGDKNFWLELVKIFRKQGNNIHILSVNMDIANNYSVDLNVQCQNLAPIPFPAVHSRFVSSLKYYNNLGSRSISFFRLVARIRKVISDEDVDVLHFMDDYGPVMMLPVGIGNSRSSIFASAFSQTPFPFYNLVLRLKFSPFSRIVATTYALKRKLIGVGVPESRMRVIHWGVDTSKLKPNSQTKEKTKEKLDINEMSKVVLWAGFTQQVSFDDFLYSLEIAKAILKRVNDCIFIFLFKKPHFRKEYSNHASKELRVLVTNSNQEFLELINASDIFLSPILRTDAIVAPPLTWIECMSYEVPVVTTPNAGVDELIRDGYTGYIFNTFAEGVNKILGALKDEKSLNRVAVTARRFVCQRFEINQIASEYMNLWRQICDL